MLSLYVIITCTKCHSSLDVYSVYSKFVNFVKFPIPIQPHIEISWFYVVHISFFSILHVLLHCVYGKCTTIVFDNC